MSRRIALGTIAGALMAAAVLGGCGGGGETSQAQASTQQGSPTVLAWNAPATFSDNTPMDPLRDISHYELYVRADRNFSDNDFSVAEIAAVSNDSSSGAPAPARSATTQFNLNLLPSVPDGSRVYISLKAVGVDAQKSEFMTPVAWDRS